MDTYELSFDVEHDPEDQYDVLMVELDATVSLHHGLVVVALSVDAESATDAARSALEQLRAHGVVVRRLYNNLVTRRDIAERCGVSTAAVGQWIRGERGPREFPSTYNSVGSGVWWWAEVNEWLRRVDRHDGGRYLTRDEHTAIDYGLLLQSQLREAGVSTHVELPLLTEYLSSTWWTSVRWPMAMNYDRHLQATMNRWVGSTFKAPALVMQPGTHAVTTVRADTVRTEMVLTA